MSDESSSYRPRCQNICCKSMLVYGEDFQMDPEYQEGVTEFWCQLTTKELGPDGSIVSLEDCSDPERECYREY